LGKAAEVCFVEKIVTGAAPYLNVKSQLILTLFGHVLDSLDYQLTFETWRTKFFDLKKKECDILGHSPPDNPPCDNTVRGLLQKPPSHKRNFFKFFIIF
jgi:hypothetical protein